MSINNDGSQSCKKANNESNKVKFSSISTKEISKKKDIEIKRDICSLVDVNNIKSVCKKLIQPTRPLSDIPEPARRFTQQIGQIYGKKSQIVQSKKPESLSKWDLMKSHQFSDYLNLLKVAGLAIVPKSFYENRSHLPLIKSLKDLTMIDMSDIFDAISMCPALTRHGIVVVDQPSVDDTYSTGAMADEEILSRDYSPDWEVILYPDRFDEAEGSLATDIMACSIVVHVLKQCSTRKSINDKYTAEDITHYVRSYLLSQCNYLPHLRHQIRHTPIFAGHIIMAAHYLGWLIEVDNKIIEANMQSKVCFNVTSRCGLFMRYPVLSDYFVNGWK